MLGYDVAGIVDELGADVDHISVGDPVMAMTGFPRGAGGYAELVVTHSDMVATLEPGTDLVEAAATPRHRSSISIWCSTTTSPFTGC